VVVESRRLPTGNVEQIKPDAEAIYAALVDARAEVREAARRQAVWKDKVGALLVSGRAAGLPVTEIAKLRGLSRRWTTQLLDCERARVLRGVHENSIWFSGGRLSFRLDAM
jgi:hypothetical protein